MIIKVRAKVKRIQETDLEFRARDMGTMSWKGDDWVWTNLAIRTEEIRNASEYSDTKTMIEDYEGGQTLIAEKFDSFCERWEKAEQLETEELEQTEDDLTV
jgi:hypothetical protein